MNIAFTICSANHLPFAKSLADSILQHNSNYKFIIALADTYDKYDRNFFVPHTIIPVTEMDLPFFKELSDKYNIFELSCALKPFVARYLLDANKDCEAFFYFDSDILVYAPLIQAEAILQNHCLIITPHIATPLTYEAGISTELSVLRTGLYNAGFFAINRTTESLMFLEWWQERLKYNCFDDAANGLFVDQLWLNFAPIYFRNTYVLYNPGYNLAYWNFLERKLTMENGKFMVNGNHPLVFFHYSGFNIHQPQTISKHKKQHVLEMVPEYFPLFEKYISVVNSNNITDFFFACYVRKTNAQKGRQNDGREEFF